MYMLRSRWIFAVKTIILKETALCISTDSTNFCIGQVSRSRCKPHIKRNELKLNKFYFNKKIKQIFEEEKLDFIANQYLLD